MTEKTIDIHVPVLARVEGEGALELKITDQHIDELRLRIYEPPRYFEKFLEGRNYYDIPDTVARICGICPVAYQMSAIHALESIFDLSISPWSRAMRRVMYCGEWLQSHSLHIHMLAAPDYLGFNSVIEMAEEYAAEVKRGLQLQTLGNDLIALMGGRSVHPVGVRAGGFFKAPSKQQVSSILQRLEAAIPQAQALLRWTTSLDLPDEQQDFTSVAMRHEHEYPLNEGRIVSDKGLDIGLEDYEQHFRELHIPHSTALHSLLHEQPYLVGPLARLNLNQDKLPQELRALIAECGLSFPSKNMFHSIHARAIEIYYVIYEAIRILEDYALPDSPYLEPQVKAGIGFGCSEAPRGLLWHRYELNEKGLVERARIVPPTSQNQARIEEDLRLSLQYLGLDKDEASLRLHAEKVIRNYDPCISCATHFLDLTLQRQTSTAAAFNAEAKPISAKKSAIIGLGSPLATDHLGLAVIARLQQEQLLKEKGFDETNLFALDRPGLSLLDSITGFEQVVLIDAIYCDAEPGKLFSLSFDELENNLQKEAGLSFSSHELGVLETLRLGAKLKPLPEILIIGMNVKDTKSIQESSIETIIKYIKQIL